MKPQALTALVLTVAGLTLHGASSEWPMFRGPNCSGVAGDATPPIKFSPTNSVVWKVAVPFSPSCPCVWDDQIFLTAFADGELQTRCYQRRDGKLSWSRGVKVEKLE